MNGIDGIFFLLNQAGIALAQAHAEIERLTAENARLISEAQPIADPEQ